MTLNRKIRRPRHTLHACRCAQRQATCPRGGPRSYSLSPSRQNIPIFQESCQFCWAKFTLFVCKFWPSWAEIRHLYEHRKLSSLQSQIYIVYHYVLVSIASNLHHDYWIPITISISSLEVDRYPVLLNNNSTGDRLNQSWVRSMLNLTVNLTVFICIVLSKFSALATMFFFDLFRYTIHYE